MDERAKRLNNLKARVKTRADEITRLLSWLTLFSAPTDKGVGTTILRFLKSHKRKTDLKDQLELLLKSYECSNKRISVATLDRVYPNPHYTTPTNFNSLPGDSLNHYLSKFGMNIDKSCNCTTWVDIMNAWGVVTCRQKTDQILLWLKTEATSRNLEFDSATARVLIEKSLAESEKLT